MALKARMRKACREVKSTMKIRWRGAGSRVVEVWLASNMSGSSQQVRTRRGEERGSVAMWGLKKAQPVSEGCLSQDRLIRAIIKLCVSVVGQSHLAGTRLAVGRSIRVGMRIFSIAGG